MVERDLLTLDSVGCQAKMTGLLKLPEKAGVVDLPDGDVEEVVVRGTDGRSLRLE